MCASRVLPATSAWVLHGKEARFVAPRADPGKWACASGSVSQPRRGRARSTPRATFERNASDPGRLTPLKPETMESLGLSFRARKKNIGRNAPADRQKPIVA